MTLRFDAAYYQRFYEDPRTRVYDQKRHAKLINGVVGFAEWFGLELRDVLDVGAGLGWWGQWLRKNRPKAKVVSTELEEAICRAHGHLQADLRTFRLEQKFDLVICQGVLPYLDSKGCELAINNLAAMSGGLLYLEAITHLDLNTVCDRTLTDVDVHDRKGSWYRDRLGRHFEQIGAGLWHKQNGPLLFYELERAPRRRLT